MKRLWLLIILAFFLWALMFSPWTAPHIPFWWAMTGSALILTSGALTSSDMKLRRMLKVRSSDNSIVTDGSFVRARVLSGFLKTVLWGIAIAVALWGVFWLGNEVSTWLFSFARPQVNLIYGMKEGESPLLISTLLLLLIGPAEEIFWRGYVQRQFSMHYSPNTGFLLATICYTLVHVVSLNFMLVMASMVCGIAWGGLYRLFPKRLPSIILSHALWDAAVFVWFPI